ncbi:uncharacterized protein LOC134823881 [Bolinopsis microptera]|uniref:uncharacterized protein LOC134823881 n=1 Tax=Bolinopsis microptera TaxID=2820187 RepID=UPI003079C629
MTFLGCCCNEKLKNVLITGIAMGISFSAVFPAGAVQNIALEETSDIPLTVGYYSAIIQNIGSMVTALVFQFLYNRLGLRLTAGLSIVLTTGSYWPMIWITNQYVIYAGEFLSGIGRGAGWIFAPMIVMDNSEVGKSHRNMGYLWTTASAGMVLGGLVNYFYFVEVSSISTTNRQIVYALCAGVTVLASLLAGFGISEIKGRESHKTTADVTYVKIDESNGEDDSVMKVDESSIGDDVVIMPKEDGDKKEGMDGDELNNSFSDFIVWFKMMARRPVFWLHFVPLIYTGFICAYFYKMFPTAIPSISNQRKLIPLTTVVIGGSNLVGSATSNIISRWITPTACIVLSGLLILVAMILSILIFPKEAFSQILEIGAAETFIKGGIVHLMVISALIGLGDSMFAVIYDTAIGRLFDKKTSFGYSINTLVYHLMYGIGMFSPTLFDIHSYCYITMVTVVASCLALAVGLKQYVRE